MTDADRRLSAWHALSVLLGVLLGVGVLYVPKRVENLAGPATPLAFLVATAGAVALAVSYAVFLSGPLGDDGGGAYLHLSRTWRSRAVGFLLVWPKPLAYAALVALLAQYLSRTLAAPLGVGSDLFALVVLLGLLVLRLVGPRFVGQVGLLLSGTLVVSLLLLAVSTLRVFVVGNFFPVLPTPPLQERPVLSLGRAVLVALFGFVGFDAIAALGGDVRSPRLTLPRVTLAGVAGAGLLVTGLAFATLGVIPWTRLLFANAPFVDAAASALGVPSTRIFTPAVVLATVAALVALSWPPVSTLAGLAEVLPPLSHTNRFGTPDVAAFLVVGTAGALVFTDAVSVGLFVAVPGLLVLYVAHGVTTALLPRVNRSLYEDCAFGLSPRLLAITGLSGAGVATLLLWQTLTLDPAVVLGYTRVGPAVTGTAADPLIRTPMESVVPALVGWETVGVLVYVAARDYREERGFELEPLTGQ